MAYRKIDDGKLTAIAYAVRTKLDATVTMKPGEMPQLIEDIGIGYIPSYWRSYLAGKASEINTALNAAGDKKSAFLWYTDAHWVNNYGQSPMILKYLSKNTGMRKTFFGGDVAQATSGEIDILTAWKAKVSGVENHYSAIGNHDNQVTDFSTAAERADFFIPRNGCMAMGTDATNGKMYYYVDDHIENTRYIVLSTGRMWTTNDEIPWCIDALNSTPKGWHIVIASHLWLDNEYGSDGTTLIPEPPEYAQSYLDLFDAYNYRMSGTTSFGSVAYNFASAEAKIEFIIGGHVHQDYDFATTKGIPIVLTECDSWAERDSASVATKGTTTENCVYAIVADYAAKRLKIINVGRGDTRTRVIPDVVTYTNALKTAIDTDGSLYNGGKGYKEGYRLDSAGKEVAFSLRDVTGFIATKRGDVVRFRNMTFKPDNQTAHVYIMRYTSSFAFNSSSGITTESSLSAWAPVFDADGNVLQVTIPSAISSSAVYFRFCVQDINDNSIITVNEEID